MGEEWVVLGVVTVGTRRGGHVGSRLVWPGAINEEALYNMYKPMRGDRMHLSVSISTSPMCEVYPGQG